MPRRRYLDDAQALRRRDRFPSFNNTAKSDNTRVVPVEKRAQYVKQKEKEQVVKKQARKQRAKQVATKIVAANNPNGVSPWDTKSAMFIANAEAHPEQFEKEYANWYSKVPYDLANTGAQLYDKDKVNLAKAQQAFYRDAAANIGVDWGNKLNPYTQQDLIANATNSFGVTNATPYTLPLFASFTPGMAARTFMGNAIGGEVGGLIGSQVATAASDKPWAPLVGGITGGIIGGGIGGYIPNRNYIALSNTLNKNINEVTLPNNTTNIVKDYVQPKIPKSDYTYYNGRGYKTDDIFNLPKKINKETARTLTDDQWDFLYFNALDKRNTKRLKRLRNLHYLAKSGNSTITDASGMPKTLYHTVNTGRYDPSFNSYNTTIEGEPSFVYTSPSYRMSRSYNSNENLSNKEMKRFRHNIVQSAEKEWHRMEHAYNRVNDFKSGIINKSRIGIHRLMPAAKRYERYKNLGKDNYIKTYIKNILDNTNFRNGVKELYGKLDNPVIINNNGRVWNNLVNYTLGNDFNGIPITYDGGSTRTLESNVRGSNFDGFVVKNVIDYGKKMDNPIPKDVISFRNPKSLKYKSPITFDDDGNIIPLSKRDNFNINDFRYGIIPIAIGGASLHKSNKNKNKTN